MSTTTRPPTTLRTTTTRLQTTASKTSATPTISTTATSTSTAGARGILPTGVPGSGLAGTAGTAAANKAAKNSTFTKKILPIIIVLVVLLVAICVALWAWRQHKKKKAQKEAAAKADRERETQGMTQQQQSQSQDGQAMTSNPNPGLAGRVEEEYEEVLENDEGALDGGAHANRPIPKTGAAAEYYTDHPDAGATSGCGPGAYVDSDADAGGEDSRGMSGSPTHREVDRMEHIAEEPEYYHEPRYHEKLQQNSVLNKLQSSFGHHGERR